jgi:hypothetical protein
MKQLIITTFLVTNLVACASNSSPKQSETPGDQLHPGDLQEEMISRPKEPEAKRIKIAQPGISPNTILNGIADVLVDGTLESDSLEKENFVHVLLDDTIEHSARTQHLKRNPPDKNQLPK